jgi:hypothetical protein
MRLTMANRAKIECTDAEGGAAVCRSRPILPRAARAEGVAVLEAEG